MPSARSGSTSIVIHDVMQRVAPEQRHEPRRAGGDDGAVGVLGVEDAQAREVVGRAFEQLAELVVVGA